MKLNEDVLEIKNLLSLKKSFACEDCFLGYLVWQKKYGFERIPDADSLVIHIKNNSSYYLPFSIDKNKVISSIQQLLNQQKLVFERLTAESRKFLEETFPDRFDFADDRGNSDYIYDIDSLCHLKGKKLSKKRNHINGFLNTYDNWYVKPLDISNLDEVLDFAAEWYENRKSQEGENTSLDYERESLFQVLPVLQNIGGEGIVLYVNDEVRAFTVGQKISETVYDTVFEKASENIKGAYNMINREFALFLKNKYPELKYINRESDVGHPGLRQAKLSYSPAFILEKFVATCKY